jgi:hypothetical protein
MKKQKEKKKRRIDELGLSLLQLVILVHSYHPTIP